ncbi:hypothetical protein niasHT_020134 [Heterodera trifolii]|uniref:Uncharacterized protein n=1 Tax=Heterodera trifolii TaxID=157864 RepID=A0ABD2KIC0_9BILA
MTAEEVAQKVSNSKIVGFVRTKMPFHPLLIALFLVIIFGNCADADVMGDVKEYIKLFNTIAEPSGDFGDAMHKIGRISEKAAGLIGLSAPVANLLASIAHTEPHEEVLLALSEFRRDIFKRLDYLEMKNFHLMRDFKLSQYLTQYTFQIEMPLANAVATFKKMLKTGVRKNSTTVQDFISRCRNVIVSPIVLMRNLNTLLVENCPHPTKGQSLIFVAVSRFFEETRKRNASYFEQNKRTFDHMAKESTHLMSHLHYLDVIERLNELKETISRGGKTGEEIEKTLVEMWKRLESDIPRADRCILNAVVDGEEWKRDEVFGTVEFFKNQLLIMQELANKCTNISSDHQQFTCMVAEKNGNVLANRCKALRK